MSTRETSRLLLRPPHASDLDAFVEIHEDPEVMRYLTPVGQLAGRTAGWRMLALLIGHWQLRGYGQWTVLEKGTRDVIGRVGLWNPEGWPGLEVGWVIRRSRWGNGFATEAAREAIRFAFDDVRADHIISLIRPDNARSIRVAEKLGETFERTHLMDGTPLHVYGLHRPAARATTPVSAAT
ncbi:MAG TPA: GNAT family N-acetyltransferase [Vicinamibacterales bacterium]|nr:GNAT family N-acetyltransferase [Vicinamibacterales bacterium]